MIVLVFSNGIVFRVNSICTALSEQADLINVNSTRMPYSSNSHLIRQKRIEPRQRFNYLQLEGYMNTSPNVSIVIR